MGRGDLVWAVLKEMFLHIQNFTFKSICCLKYLLNIVGTAMSTGLSNLLLAIYRKNHQSKSF